MRDPTSINFHLVRPTELLRDRSLLKRVQAIAIQLDLPLAPTVRDRRDSSTASGSN